MDVPGPERRLAAVLAADMVGYSRLMEVDETGTLARLKTHRIELIDPAIAKNRGRIIKTTGDGMLRFQPKSVIHRGCSALLRCLIFDVTDVSLEWRQPS